LAWRRICNDHARVDVEFDEQGGSGVAGAMQRDPRHALETTKHGQTRADRRPGRHLIMREHGVAHSVSHTLGVAHVKFRYPGDSSVPVGG
jgi:hypothetical protein